MKKSKQAEPARKPHLIPLRCWLDGALLADSPEAPGSLCPECDNIEVVDVVRQLYRRRNG